MRIFNILKAQGLLTTAPGAQAVNNEAGKKISGNNFFIFDLFNK